MFVKDDSGSSLRGRSTKTRRAIQTTPLQVREPQSEGSSGRPVRGQVNWFNPGKRYGFVELLDGSGDAFLHATALSIGVGTRSRARRSSFEWLWGSGVRR